MAEEEWRERVFRALCDDAAVVQPDALEDQAEKLPLPVVVFLDAQDDADVVELVSALNVR